MNIKSKSIKSEIKQAPKSFTKALVARPAAASPAGKKSVSRDSIQENLARDSYLAGRSATKGLRVVVQRKEAGGYSRLRVMDMTRGNIDAAGKPKGLNLVRVDGPHPHAPKDHIHFENMPPALANLPKRMEIPRIPEVVLRASKHAGKVVKGLGLAADAFDVNRARESDAARGDGKLTETKKAMGRVVGGWSGSAAGTAVGAAIGTAIFPGLGTALGAFVGGLAFGVVGGAGGSAAGEWIMSERGR
jgi:hypothetical protein